MLTIKGRVKTGCKAANLNLPLQIKHFVTIFPEIKDCYLGSINIGLEKPFKILSYDFVTEPIRWHPEHTVLQEKFGFVRIKFRSENAGRQQLIDAWIYDPFGSPWHSDPFTYEIIAPWVDFDRDKPCYININCKYNEDIIYYISASPKDTC